MFPLAVPLLLISPVYSGVSIVDFLVNSVNQSVDPCNDFFSYACTSQVNKIEKLQRIVDNRLIGSLYENITEEGTTTSKARILFQQCCNRQELEERGPKVLLKQLERITQLNFYTVAGHLDLTNLTIEAWRLMGLRPWFTFDVSEEKPEIKIAYPEPFLKNTSHLGVEDRQMLREKYIDYLTTFFMYYVEDLQLPTEEEDVRRQIIDVVDFEERLFALIVRLVWNMNSFFQNENGTIEGTGIRTTLGELQKQFPLVDIGAFYKAFASKETAKVLDGNFSLDIHVDSDYFSRLTELLQDSPEFTIKSYIIMMIAREQVFELTGKYWKLKNSFLQNVLNTVGVWPFPTREDACLNITQSLFPQLVARIYVEGFFTEDIRKSARDILNNLITTFHSILQEAVWMDTTTRDYALLKLESMGREVGYMDRLLNDTFLEESHRIIDVSNQDDFATNVEKIMSYSLRRQLETLINPIREMNPVATSVDAFNFKENNHIAVPAVLLQPPFYHPLWPMVINYAGLGYTVGHEIAHSFDTEGIRYGFDGSIEAWLTRESLQEYEKRAQCFTEQYSSLLIPEVNRTVDGARTLNENLADNIGIRMAYKAYQQSHWEPRLSLQVSNDQLFFIMATQMDCVPYKPAELNKFMDLEDHAVPRARINLPLSNFPEFAKAFNCPEESPMNPGKRCRMF